MQIVTVRLVTLEISDRRRPAAYRVVEQLARDIEKRGLRQPIEVAKTKGGHRLVAGLHRVMACKSLGWTEIPAVVVKGDAVSLRRDELLENLARNELSKLERCLFVAELKRLHQEENPAAKNGGDRKSAEFAAQNQSAKFGNLIDWYSDVAARSDRAVRSIAREAMIGERLSPEPVPPGRPGHHPSRPAMALRTDAGLPGSRGGNDRVEVGTNKVYAAIHQFGGTIEKYAQSRQIYRRYDKRSGALGNRFVSRSKSNFATWHEIKEHTIDIPARPFLGVSADDEAEFDAIARDWLDDILPEDRRGGRR